MSLRSKSAAYFRSAALRKGKSVLGTGVRLNGRPRVQLAPRSLITLGPGVVLNSRWKANALGMSAPTTLITTEPGAEIYVGERSGLSGCVLSAAESIWIGNRVLIGEGVMITDNDHHPVDISDVRSRRDTKLGANKARGVRIEDDVFIGARVIVLKGVTIGAGTVVGAGSVVSVSLPPGVVAAGNPCRVLRQLKTQDLVKGN
jgi:carbonic anhydrase/acetyltransferase-like protein (isoleucine patch superfamily)